MDMPLWVQDLLEKHNGVELTYIMEKTIQPSDTNKQQNRFRIDNPYGAFIRDLLTDDERRGANLVHPPKKRSAGELALNNNRESLPVKLYNVEGQMFSVRLTHWESCDATVLIGGEEVMRFVGCSKLDAGDQVVMWSFREEQGRQLCFIIGKIRNRIKLFGVDIITF